MEHRNQEETVRAIRNTSQHHPPRQKRGYELKHSCSFDNRGIRRIQGITVEIANGYQQKGKIDGQE